MQSHVVIEGEVAIGRGNFIGHGAIIGVPPQDVSFSTERKTKVEIGNDNVIREYCTIHRGSPDGSVTKIGDKNFLMSGAHIGHNCLIGNNVVIANNCLLAGHVRVDDGAFLGGGSTFHQFMHIGRLVMVQGSSAFGKDLPPFVVAAERNYVFGLNIVGMRRAGLSANDRNEIKEAFKLVYLSGLNTSQALDKAADDDLWRTSSRIPGLRCQCKEAWDLPVETWHGRRRFGLTTQAESRGADTQPPCTGGMIAISSPDSACNCDRQIPGLHQSRCFCHGHEAQVFAHKSFRAIREQSRLAEAQARAREFQ